MHVLALRRTKSNSTILPVVQLGLHFQSVVPHTSGAFSDACAGAEEANNSSHQLAAAEVVITKHRIYGPPNVTKRLQRRKLLVVVYVLTVGRNRLIVSSYDLNTV
jgi:hypothetical protein